MGYCGKCGAELTPGACFCPSCGNGVSPIPQGAKKKRALYRMKPAADPRPYRGDVLAVFLLLGWQLLVLLLMVVSRLFKHTEGIYWVHSILLDTSMLFYLGCIGCNRGMLGLGMSVAFRVLDRVASLLFVMVTMGVPAENIVFFSLRSLPQVLMELLLIPLAWGLTYVFSGRRMALGCLLFPLLIWLVFWAMCAAVFATRLTVPSLLSSLAGAAMVAGAMFLRSAMAEKEERARAAA